jgi:hypothetical protein
MTGKELIRYIIDHDLEQEQVFQNGKFIGFLTREEAAQKFNVGVATVTVWYQFGALDGFAIGGEIFIAANATPNISKSKQIDLPLSALNQYITNYYKKE